MYQVDILEAKEKLLELIAAAQRGEEVAINQDNQPVVKLVGIPPANKKRWSSKAGSAKGMVWMSDDFDEPLEEFKEYMESGCCWTLMPLF
ncbi:type II toxin-antitoxin system prevent-host-death family antitoxin [Microcoleus sp. F4-D5]|uniref:type II toxin-antitoxin system prevent-host-death family antitoxin n=1 Tax=Microcoleus sp. F4-D5 TaxID=2818760 RepID=UPI002FD591C8